MKKLIPIVLIVFLASCANAPKTGQGAAIGGAGGAAVGAAISRATGGSGWTGAAIGAVAGTVAGAIIGNTQDQNQGSLSSSKPGKALDPSTFPGTYSLCLPTKDKFTKNDCYKRDNVDTSIAYVFQSNGTGHSYESYGRQVDNFNWTHLPENKIQIIYNGKGNGEAKKGQKEICTRVEIKLLECGNYYIRH